MRFFTHVVKLAMPGMEEKRKRKEKRKMESLSIRQISKMLVHTGPKITWIV